MASNAHHFDIILVHGFFRAHNHYMNIVKYLSAEYRIGIYVVDASKRGSASGSNQMLRVKETDDLFLECLKSLGAEILEEGNYECGLLIFPQVNFSPDFVKDTSRRITRKNAIVLQTFGYDTQLLKDFSEIGIKQLFVYDHIIFNNKLINIDDKSFVNNNFEVVEMGCPFNKYPLFDDIEIDYMIAYPTAMLIKDPYIKNTLLTNIQNLVYKIDQDEKIVLKLHNVRDNGNRIFRSYHLLNISSQIQIMLADGIRFFGSRPHRFFGENKLLTKSFNFSNNIKHTQIEKTSIILSDMTPYYNFGLELFLPSVKKGLITGISSSMWYALYNNIPVYNCDDQPFTEEGIINSSTYKSFYVSPCRGKLEYNSRDFNKVPSSAREADLIELIKHNT